MIKLSACLPNILSSINRLTISLAVPFVIVSFDFKASCLFFSPAAPEVVPSFSAFTDGTFLYFSGSDASSSSLSFLAKATVPKIAAELKTNGLANTLAVKVAIRAIAEDLPNDVNAPSIS